MDDRLARMEALLRAATQQSQTLLQGHSPTTGLGVPNDTGGTSSPFTNRQHEGSLLWNNETAADVERPQPVLSPQQDVPSNRNINVVAQAGSTIASASPSQTGTNTATRVHSLPESVALMSPDIGECLSIQQAQDPEPSDILPSRSTAPRSGHSEAESDANMSYTAASAPFMPTPASSYAINSTTSRPDYSSASLVANAAPTQNPTSPRDHAPAGLVSTTTFATDDRGIDVDADEDNTEVGIS